MPIPSRSMAASITLLALAAQFGCQAEPVAAEPEHQPDPPPIFGDAAPQIEPFQAREAHRPPSPPEPVITVEEHPLPAMAESHPVKQGEPPLVYRVESDTAVRIVDLTTNQTVASATVERLTLLSIDQAAGIRIGRDRVVPGPLPEGRRYAIFLDNTEPGYYRTKLQQPPPEEQ